MEEQKAEEKELIKDDGEDKFRIYSCVAFIIVVGVIGLPMWWKTTEVYRVRLPYEDIKKLSEEPIQISVNIGIFTFDPSRSSLMIKELQTHFENNTDSIWKINFIHIYTNTTISSQPKTPAALENYIKKYFDMRPGDFLFLEWPKLVEDILITTERTALIRGDTSSVKIIQLLRGHVLQTYRIKSIISDEKTYEYKDPPPQINYDILISVINPRPDMISVKWNVQLASEMYISPFLEKINLVSNYTLRTQWRYQSFDLQLKQIRDNSILGRHYSISEDSLPHIITSIEKNLGGGISDHSFINIVIYTPPCEVSPLHIYRKNMEMATANNVDSFISVKWGGVIFYNPPMELCKEYMENHKEVTLEINSNNVMQIVLFQLQKLLDIYNEVTLKNVKSDDIEELSPRKWEYESYIRRSVVNHITTSIQTLQSLIKLLDNISYIVINDEVGEAIINAHEKILKAKECLRNNDLMNAAKFAKEAFISSEHAFFDSSLLAQLYFPDEQKYAVYIPLFLPIIVPIITSVATVKKYWKNTKK